MTEATHPEPVRPLVRARSSVRRPRPADRWTSHAAARISGVSLTRRFVLVLLLLLCLCFVAVAGLSALVFKHALVQRLDRDVAAASYRYAALNEDPSDNDHDADDSFLGMVGPVKGTLGVQIVNGRVAHAEIVRPPEDKVPAADQLALLSVQPSLKLTSVTLPNLGDYRLSVLRGPNDEVFVLGLPRDPIDRSVAHLLRVEAIIMGVALALTVTASALLVRSSMRPAHSTAQALVDVRASENRLRNLMTQATHELRTPAAVIHSYAEYAERANPGLPPSVDHALRRIGSESSRMGRIVDDLMMLSRFDAGYEPDLRHVDLIAILEDAVQDANVNSADHRWVLRVPIEAVSVRGDDQALYQALAGILANAHAHTPPKTTVTITLSIRDQSAVISVVDDGPGIEPTILPLVFERFVRSSNSVRYDGSSGAGLGLAVVAEIVRVHNGDVSVTSTVGRTEFLITLPLLAEAKQL